MEPLGKRRDRSVRTPELFQNTAPGGVRECSERDIEVGLDQLNHMVQCTRWRDGMQWEAGAPAALSAVHLTHNQRYETADAGLLSPELAAGIRRVKGVRRLGVRLGNWLTVERGPAVGARGLRHHVA